MEIGANEKRAEIHLLFFYCALIATETIVSQEQQQSDENQSYQPVVRNQHDQHADCNEKSYKSYNLPHDASIVLVSLYYMPPAAGKCHSSSGNAISTTSASEISSSFVSSFAFLGLVNLSTRSGIISSTFVTAS